jgi:hypothetical protein
LETLRLTSWSEADLAFSPAELPILRHWTPPPPLICLHPPVPLPL